MKWVANQGQLRDSYLINTGPVPSPASSLPSSLAFSEMGKSGIQFRYLHPPLRTRCFLWLVNYDLFGWGDDVHSEIAALDLTCRAPA